jgi:hypothetical protein
LRASFVATIFAVLNDYPDLWKDCAGLGGFEALTSSVTWDFPSGNCGFFLFGIKVKQLG